MKVLPVWSSPAALSWALYDFANSVFPLNVVSLYFPLWVTVDLGAPDLYYSLASSIPMLLVAISSPVLGALSDQYGRRVPFLAFFSILCVVFTASLSWNESLLGGLLLFTLANYCYQSGLVYYNALLPVVSEEAHRGRVSGLAVALGYLGAILGILMVRPLVAAGGHRSAFAPTAALFLAFAIPCLTLVREAGRPRAGVLVIPIRQAFWQIVDTARHAQQYPGLARFLLARFLYVDSINTASLFAAIYAHRVFGFTNGELQSLLILGATFAVVGSFGYGFLADRWGPKRTLTVVLSQWMALFLLAVLGQSKAMFWLFAPLAGACLGATWLSDRLFLLRLAPADKVGEFFGLYALSGRFAAIVGPLLWGFTTWALADLGVLKYRLSLATLLLLMAAGFVLLQGVSDRRLPPTS